MARSSPLSKSLVVALDRVATPVYVLDEERRLIFANAAFNTWVGVESESLVGQALDYVPASSEPRSIRTSGLAPPPEAFRTSAGVGVVTAVDGLGNFHQRSASFQPLVDSAGQVTLLLVVVDHQETVADESTALSAASGTAAAALHLQLLAQRAALGKKLLVSQLVGASPAQKQLRAQVQLAATAGRFVLIEGRAGSGQEQVARTIHAAAPRAAALPLIPVDCELMIAETLAGALAPAIKAKPNSSGGPIAALLLKRVDRLSKSAQVELLQLLPKISAETLVLSTSNRNLYQRTLRGKFLPELASQLATLGIRLVPLRQRPEDVLLLAQFVLEQTAAEGKSLSGFTSEALEQLVAYQWPGETAELTELVRQSAASATQSQVTAADLPQRLRHAALDRAHPPREEEPIKLDELLTQIEKELMARAMRLARGNKTKAAQWLGVHRARLIRRLPQLGLAEVGKVDDEEAVIFEPLVEGDSAAEGSP